MKSRQNLPIIHVFQNDIHSMRIQSSNDSLYLYLKHTCLQQNMQKMGTLINHINKAIIMYYVYIIQFME